MVLSIGMDFEQGLGFQTRYNCREGPFWFLESSNLTPLCHFCSQGLDHERILCKCSETMHNEVAAEW